MFCVRAQHLTIWDHLMHLIFVLFYIVVVDIMSFGCAFQVEHPPASMKQAWKKVVSSQRKRAVMACFRMIPLHNLPR